jgi:DNA repair protein RadC
LQRIGVGWTSHPSSGPTPSRAHIIQMTQAIVDMAKRSASPAHDYLIVGRNGHASFRGLKLM